MLGCLLGQRSHWVLVGADSVAVPLARVGRIGVGSRQRLAVLWQFVGLGTLACATATFPLIESHVARVGGIPMGRCLIWLCLPMVLEFVSL